MCHHVHVEVILDNKQDWSLPFCHSHIFLCLRTSKFLSFPPLKTPFKFSLFVCVHACAPWCTCGDKETCCRSHFLYCTMWILGVEFRLTSLHTSKYLYWSHLFGFAIFLSTYFLSVVFRIEHRALCMLGKHCTTELYLST